MSGPRYDLVPHRGLEATPRPPDPEPESETEWLEPGRYWRPGKILFAACVAIATGCLVASGLNS